MDKKTKGIKLITIISTIVMFVCIIILAFQLVQISNLKTQQKNLQSKKDQLIEQIYNYNTSNSYYENNRSEYLEDLAKEKNMGKADEVWYSTKN